MGSRDFICLGNFDRRITLDKEGPIHEFSWSPNLKEFGVVSGCKLHAYASDALQSGRQALHDFGTFFYNLISFDMHSRLAPDPRRRNHDSETIPRSPSQSAWLAYSHKKDGASAYSMPRTGNSQ
ncbi:hypothetical protein EI94DRAFT_890254 [Lactarius quietus]|nr:hypothetical protein EI94DRAFT_890254 [Lactarius quietus]